MKPNELAPVEMARLRKDLARKERTVALLLGILDDRSKMGHINVCARCLAQAFNCGTDCKKAIAAWAEAEANKGVDLT